MSRQPNTRKDGRAFDEATIEAVWQKGEVDAARMGFRKDMWGASIERSKYGKEDPFGWEIDHIYPICQGGSDNLANLQPLHRENNRQKGDTYPDFTYKVC